MSLEDAHVRGCAEADPSHIRAEGAILQNHVAEDKESNVNAVILAIAAWPSPGCSGGESAFSANVERTMARQNKIAGQAGAEICNKARSVRGHISKKLTQPNNSSRE